MHGIFTDPLDPRGQSIPFVTYIKRYDPNWWLESSTRYGLREGPVEWYNRHPNGEKEIGVSRTPVGLRVTFHDARGQEHKEWLVNKHGQVYRQQIRQDQQWTVTHDLTDLATSADVPWGEPLREFMEYYPGRDEP